MFGERIVIGMFVVQEENRRDELRKYVPEEELGGVLTFYYRGEREIGFPPHLSTEVDEVDHFSFFPRAVNTLMALLIAAEDAEEIAAVAVLVV